MQDLAVSPLACAVAITPGPQPGKVERKLAVMPDGKQVNRGIGLRCAVQHEVVAIQVFAQGLGGAGRQRGELQALGSGLALTHPPSLSFTPWPDL